MEMRSIHTHIALVGVIDEIMGKVKKKIFSSGGGGILKPCTTKLEVRRGRDNSKILIILGLLMYMK